MFIPQRARPAGVDEYSYHPTPDMKASSLYRPDLEPGRNAIRTVILDHQASLRQMLVMALKEIGRAHV